MLGLNTSMDDETKVVVVKQGEQKRCKQARLVEQERQCQEQEEREHKEREKAEHKVKAEAERKVAAEER